MGNFSITCALMKSRCPVAVDHIDSRIMTVCGPAQIRTGGFPAYGSSRRSWRFGGNLSWLRFLRIACVIVSDSLLLVLCPMTQKLSHNPLGFRPSLSDLGGCLRHFIGTTSSSDCPVICLLIVGLLHLHQPVEYLSDTHNDVALPVLVHKGLRTC